MSEGPNNIPPSPAKRSKTTLSPFPPSRAEAKALLRSLVNLNMFKVSVKPIVMDIMSNPPSTVHLRDVGYGSLSLIYVNKYGTEEAAYDWPIHRAIQNYTKQQAQQHSDRFFLESFDFLAALPRRVSKADNSPIWTYSDKSDGKFKQKVFLTKLKSNNPAEKKRILNLFAQFLTSNNAPTEVRVPYEETDELRQSLDEFVTDDSIIRFLQKIWKRTVDKDFYATNPRVVNEAFFSVPYPRVARDNLGYPITVPEGNDPPDNDNEPLADRTEMSVEETSQVAVTPQRAAGGLTTLTQNIPA